MKKYSAFLFLLAILPLQIFALDFTKNPTYENTSKDYILSQFPVIETFNVDESGNVVFQKIIKSEKNETKEQLFSKARSYFSTISQNKEDIFDIDETNCRIALQHNLPSVYSHYKSSTGQIVGFGADFKMVIECKDGRCRMSIFSQEYIDNREGSKMFPVIRFNRAITTEYPFRSENKKKMTKDEKMYAECFFSLVDIAADYMTRFEKYINSSSSNDDW